MTNSTGTLTFAIYRRIGFRGAWEYLERYDSLALAKDMCREYNAAKNCEDGYPAFKVVTETREI